MSELPAEAAAQLNSGIQRLGVVEGTADEPRTIVVVGVARGGTSMVAGALHHLGVPMGKPCQPPIYEDTRFDDPLAKGDARAVRKLARQSTRQWRVWGYKRPKSAQHLRLIDRTFVNPRYVVVFRDVAAVARRQQLAHAEEPESIAARAGALKLSLKKYMQITDFLLKHEPPALSISYEKAVQQPNAFLDSLMDFAQLRATADEVRAASEFVQPNAIAYVSQQEITRARRARRAQREEGAPDVDR